MQYIGVYYTMHGYMIHNVTMHGYIIQLVGMYVYIVKHYTMHGHIIQLVRMRRRNNGNFLRAPEGILRVTRCAPLR